MRAVAICILLVIGLFKATLFRESYNQLTAPLGITPHLPSDEAVGYTTTHLEVDTLKDMNSTRKSLLLTPLRYGTDISEWLAAWKTLPSNKSQLSALMSKMEEELPDYTNIHIQTARVATLQNSAQMLRSCGAARANDIDTIALHAVPDSKQGGYNLIFISALKSVPFSPEALNDRRNAILTSTCPSCNSHFAIESFRNDGPCNLVCPECNTHFSMLVADNQGDYHYINDFLIGYQPPAHFPKSVSRKEEMHKIWMGVYQTCEYRSDSRGDKKLDRDAWQTAPETLRRGVGDCDDSSILLADWLISRGFDARVAIGLAGGSGHAWVVVLLEGRTYLLESTMEPPESADEILPVTAVAGEYVPDLLFDRDACYYWKDPSAKFDNDYYSIKWRRLPQGQGATKTPNRLPMSMAASQFPKPAQNDVQITQLKELELGAPNWQITWPGVK